MAGVSRKRRDYHQTWRSHNPHKTREYWLKRYNLTQEQYDGLLVQQGGHCALCDRTPEQEPRGVLSIDHCHNTDRVRGLLCMRHNNGLGMLGDDEPGLLRALAYVRGLPWQT